MSQVPPEEDSEGPLLTLLDILYSGGVLNERRDGEVGISHMEKQKQKYSVSFFSGIVSICTCGSKAFVFTPPLHSLTIDNQQSVTDDRYRTRPYLILLLYLPSVVVD